MYNFTCVFFYVISRRMRWAGHIARMGDKKSAYMVSVVRPDGKRPLERPISTWEDNSKMYFQEVGLGEMDWIALAQYRDRWRALANAVMNLLFP